MTKMVYRQKSEEGKRTKKYENSESCEPLKSTGKPQSFMEDWGFKCESKSTTVENDQE